MKVLVDTPIWSLAFRKSIKTPQEQDIINTLITLLENSNVVIMGVVRQEVLSGISDNAKFDKLKKRLAVFDDIIITTADHEKAAEYSNLCRKKGIQGSLVDFLICAVATRLNIPIFSLDKDFGYYAKHLPIMLFDYQTFQQKNL